MSIARFADLLETVGQAGKQSGSAVGIAGVVSFYSKLCWGFFIRSGNCSSPARHHQQALSIAIALMWAPWEQRTRTTYQHILSGTARAPPPDSTCCHTSRYYSFFWDFNPEPNLSPYFHTYWLLWSVTELTRGTMKLETSKLPGLRDFICWDRCITIMGYFYI